MSTQSAQTVIDRLGIEEGDTIRSGPADAWTVESIRNSQYVDCNLVVQSHEGDWSNMDPDQVSQCQCGMYTVGDAPCYDCYMEQKKVPRIDATEMFSETEEREIVFRYVFAQDEMPTQRELAEDLGVSQATVSKIIKAYQRANSYYNDLESSIIEEFGGLQ